MKKLFLFKAKGSRQYLISFFAVLLVATLSYGLTSLVGYRVTAFMLLVTVSILAMFFEIIPVLLAAILSALIWDFFFIPPHFTFSVGTAEDRWLLIMYFIIALLNAVLTTKIRRVEKEMREKVEKAKTIKFYNTLLHSLSHELRTPIATIIGASDNLLENSIRLSEKNKNELLSEISVASLRLNEQVENLLNMSRLESGTITLKKDWCDVSELIHSSLNRLEKNLFRHKIEVNVPENLPLFSLDYVLLDHTIYNLIYNATLYTPEDSLITINAACENELPENFDVVDKVISKLVITVSDNGPGFPKDEMEKVFYKFYRLHGAKPGGTGLGLSIVKGFVEAHEGIIQLENNHPCGAKFTIAIPTEVSYINSLKNE